MAEECFPPSRSTSTLPHSRKSPTTSAVRPSGARDHPLACRAHTLQRQPVRPSGVSHLSSHAALLPGGGCDDAAERFIYHPEALDPPVAQLLDQRLGKPRAAPVSDAMSTRSLELRLASLVFLVLF